MLCNEDRFITYKYIWKKISAKQIPIFFIITSAP